MCPEGNTFVGRDREQTQLRSGLEQTFLGRGCLFLISGEPGIGKTRLADQIAREGASRGARVLWGRCWESGGSPPFWPWIEIIRSCLSAVDPRVLQAGQDSDAAIVFRLIRQLGGDSPAGVSRQPEIGREFSAMSSDEARSERFRLFGAVKSLLAGFTATTPLMIILDDLHAADEASRLLLRFLARDLRQMRIMVIVTYRETEVRIAPEIADFILDLSREGISLSLRGLGEADVASFVESQTGRSPDRAAISVLQRATEGNPFFLSEIVRLLVAEGQIEDVGLPGLSGFRIPDSVRVTIRRRVGLVSKAARDILSLASVVGREFDLAVLERISGLPASELIGALQEAMHCTLISEVPDAIARYRFSHGLIAETLCGDLSAEHRQRIHLQIGDTLQELYGSNPEEHLAELAHHYTRALPIGEVEKAVAYTSRAAGRARDVQAYEEAARLYEMALRAQSLRRPGGDDEYCDILLRLGEAYFRAGLFKQCQKSFNQAAQLAERLGDAQALAKAALGYGMPPMDPGTIDGTCISLIERALAAIGESDSSLRAMLLARFSVELYWSDQVERKKALSDEAVRMARRLNDTSALIAALWAQHGPLGRPDNLPERLSIAREIMRLADESGDKFWAHRVRYVLFVDLLEMGDVRAADEEIANYSRLTEELRLDTHMRDLALATRALMAGRFEEGEKIARRALDAGLALERRAAPYRGAFNSYMLVLLRELGRLEELHPFFTRPASPNVLARCGLALCRLEAGRVSEARAEFEYLAADDFRSSPRNVAWIATMVLLTEICCRLRDLSRAATLYKLLAPYGSRNAMLDIHACYGPVAHYLGMLAATMSLHDDAEKHFELALEMSLRMGALPFATRTQYEYAAMLLARNRPGDRERAAELLDLAIDAAGAMGMKAVGEAARALKRPQPGGDAGAGNSFHKEGEVWKLTFGGRVCHLKDMKGLAYIASLLRYPHKEIHSLALITSEVDADALDPDTDAAHVGELNAEQLSDLGLRSSRLEDAGEMLDAQAKAAYKRRRDELRDELEDAKELNDTERAARAEDQIEALSRELSRAVGLRGRDRRAASTSERARLNTRRAIKAALDKIAESDPALSKFLASSIKTGTFCSYMPAPSQTVRWKF